MRRCFCGSDLIPLFQVNKPVTRWWNGQEVQAYTCGNCGYSGFNSPSLEQLEDYYTNQYGVNAASWYNLSADYSDSKVSCRSDNVVQLIEHYLTDISDPVTLEIGCAFGGTVQKLRCHGIRAYGADLNSDAISQANAYGNNHVYSQTAQGLMGELDLKANVVYAYHSLEHMPDPAEFLKSIKPILAEDAVLEFRVPNGTYFKAWMQGFDGWDWFAYPDHLHMLSPFSAFSLASACGYDVLAITSGDSNVSLEDIGTWLGFERTEPALPIFRHMMANSIMLEELCFRLTPMDSYTAIRHAGEIRMARAKCLSNIDLEQALGRMNVNVASRFPVLTQEKAASCALSEATLG
jgi:SAM-dependent methyltransferase